jgi:hypothetical protein
MYYPHGHCKTTMSVAALRMTGMVAPMVLDGPINGYWFEAHVRQVLVPDSAGGDVVIMDNLSSHEHASVREPIEAAGARLMFLPPPGPAPGQAVQSRHQPDQESVRPPQGHALQGRRADRVRALVPHRRVG